MTALEAYKKALEIRKYCVKQGRNGCDTCVFRSGPSGNIMISCKLADDIPEFWDLRNVNERAKRQSVYDRAPFSIIGEGDEI